MRDWVSRTAPRNKDFLNLPSHQNSRKFYCLILFIFYYSYFACFFHFSPRKSIPEPAGGGTAWICFPEGPYSEVSSKFALNQDNLSSNGKEEQSRRSRESRAGAGGELSWQHSALTYLSEVTTGQLHSSQLLGSWAMSLPCSVARRTTCMVHSKSP